MSTERVSAEQKLPGLDILKNGREPVALGKRVLLADEVSDLATHRAKVFYSEDHRPQIRPEREYAFTLGFCKGYEQARQDHTKQSPKAEAFAGLVERLAASQKQLLKLRRYFLANNYAAQAGAIFRMCEKNDAALAAAKEASQ